jgi:phosphatidylglycerophosphate synthase
VITTTRFVAGMLFLFFGSVPSPWIVSWILVFAALTDLIDGRLARHFRTASARGAIFDTIADKLFVLALLLRATAATALPAWILATWILQNTVLLTGRRVLLKRAWLQGVRPGPTGMLSGFLAYCTALVAVSPLGSRFALGLGICTVLVSTVHVVIALFRCRQTNIA